MTETVRDAGLGGDVRAALRRLLDAAFGGGFSDDDWAHTCGGHRVLVREGSDLLAHAAVVPREIEVDGVGYAAGYVEGVATRPGDCGRGLGAAVVVGATAVVRATYELGVLSTGLVGFYDRFGWERWQGPSYVRDGGTLLRTEDEDEGLLVLRTGPSAQVDLHGSIVCRARPGDDW